MISFIWHGANDCVMHMVSWSKIIKPKKLGGLGIRPSRLQNTFLLGKLFWNILHSENNLCIPLLEIKYLVVNSYQNS